METVTPLHVKHKHDMTWEEYQKAKKDPEFLAQVEKAAKSRTKREEMAEYTQQILANYWFSPQLFSTIIRNFKDHATPDRTMFIPPKIDLSKFEGMSIVKTSLVDEAEALEKTGNWVTVKVSGGIGEEVEDDTGKVTIVKRPKIYEVHKKKGV